MPVEPVPAKSPVVATHRYSLAVQVNTLYLSILPLYPKVWGRILLGLMVLIFPWIALSLLLNRFGSGFTLGVFVSFPFIIFATAWMVIVYILAAQLTGRLSTQTAAISPDSIAFLRRALENPAMLDWRRAKEYAAQHIRNLRVSMAGREGSLAFEYGEATVRFAAGISKEDAGKILAEIQRHVPALSPEPGDSEPELL